jgi:hypothetical protein
VNENAGAFFCFQREEMYMNVFEAVKQSVTTRQAAESYGVKVSRHGMACCPFHDDRTPSMKVDNRFHCFGCQADGDVIDFVSRLYGISSVEAALKLAQDFCIPYEYNGRSRARPTVREPPRRQIRQDDRKHDFRVLTDYLHLLRAWEKAYAPREPEDEWHPLFVEALQQKSYIEYLADELMNCSESQFEEWKEHCGKEIKRIEKRLSEAHSTGEDEAGRGIESQCRSRAEPA